MDYAICTINNEKYKAINFEKLDASELAQKRRFLECKCGGPAFFRKASKSGQASCFGARPHKDGCDLAAPESESIGGTLTNEEKEYFNSGKEIVIDLNFGAKKVIHTVETDDDDNDRKSKGKHFSAQNGKAEAKSHRRLSTILKALMHDENYFKNSKQKIDLEGYSYSPVKLFQKFDAITNEYVDEIISNNRHTRRAIWGMISDAQYDKNKTNSIWINTGGNDTISILIDEKIHNNFTQRFKIEDINDLSGKYILAIGTLTKSKNNKIFLKLKDIAYSAIV